MPLEQAELEARALFRLCFSPRRPGDDDGPPAEVATKVVRSQAAQVAHVPALAELRSQTAEYNATGGKSLSKHLAEHVIVDA